MVNDRVIEIIGIIVKKMLKKDDYAMEEESLMQELIDGGYDIKDIDNALELIYNTTEIIKPENIDSRPLQKTGNYNRIFCCTERIFLPLDIQGIIIKLMCSNLLTVNENEQIIIKAIQKGYVDKISRKLLWQVVEEVVEDQNKLGLLKLKIQEFKEIISGEVEYIN